MNDINGLNRFSTIDETADAIGGFDSVPYFDDQSYPLVIMERAIRMAGDYNMGKVSKDIYEQALLLNSKQISDYLVHFNHVYHSDFSKAYYTYIDVEGDFSNNEHWNNFLCLSTFHGFRGICKRAIQMVKSKRKAKGGKLTPKDIEEILHDEGIF